MSDKFNPERNTGSKLPALALTRAGGNTKPAHASIYLLADHLDMVLAACEDIVEARLTWNRAKRAGPGEISAEKQASRDDVEEIRKLENTVIMRALKSRERAEEVARVDKRFRQLARLYVAGTAVLVDAVEDCRDSTDVDFATADSIPAYLRSRGLVDPEAAAPEIGEDLQVGEDFLIAKRIAAGPLMDLAAALLDSLELHYDLFLDEDELAMAPQLNRFDAADPQADAHSQSADAGSDLEQIIDEVREDASDETAEQDTNKDRDDELWARLSVPRDDVAPTDSDREDTDSTATVDLSAFDTKVDTSEDSDAADQTAPEVSEETDVTDLSTQEASEDRDEDNARDTETPTLTGAAVEDVPPASDLWDRLSKAAMAAISSRSAAAEKDETTATTDQDLTDETTSSEDDVPTEIVASTEARVSEDDIPTEISIFPSKPSKDSDESASTTDDAKTPEEQRAKHDANDEPPLAATPAEEETRETTAPQLRIVADADETPTASDMPAEQESDEIDDAPRAAADAHEASDKSDRDLKEADTVDVADADHMDPDTDDANRSDGDLIISAANDDEDDASAVASEDDTDITLDPANEDAAPEASASQPDTAQDAAAGQDATDADTASDTDQQKSKSKSLLSRLSRLKKS